MHKTWQERALELYKSGKSYRDIADTIENEFLIIRDMYDTVYSYIYRQRKNKKVNTVPNPIKHVVVQNQEPNHHVSKWDGTRTIKFGIISDTHIGSKYVQYTYLHEFYDLCQREGIIDIYHAGDLTDGLKMRVGHEYELYEVSADEMKDDVIKNYPQRPGIVTHFITGNHDASLYKQVGFDIGQAIANSRPDMHYLGKDCAVVNLTPHCSLELRHPWDGMSYSMSYRPQKMIEAMESDSKPNILVIGHYHKAFYMFYRNVHCLNGGCFQAQTPFQRGKSLSAHLGGWICEIKVDKEGTIQAFKPQFVPFYKSIKDDWKNWR